MISPKEFINPEHSLLRRTLDTLLILAALGGYKLFTDWDTQQIRADIQTNMEEREQDIAKAVAGIQKNAASAKDSLKKIFRKKASNN